VLFVVQSSCSVPSALSFLDKSVQTEIPSSVWISNDDYTSRPSNIERFNIANTKPKIANDREAQHGLL
jgi:hypothetical protein